MSLSKRFLVIASVALVLVGITPSAHAIILPPDLPLLELAPTVVSSSPLNKERIVKNSDSGSSSTIAVMFSGDMEFTGAAEGSVQVRNLTTGALVASTGTSIHKNMLYFSSDQFTHPGTAGHRYEAKVIASRIRKAGGTLSLASDYIWQFQIADRGISFFPFESENIAAVAIGKARIDTPATISFFGSSDQTAKYRITITNRGNYTLDSMVVRDILPRGFRFDTLSMGTGVTVSGTSNLTFNVDGPLLPDSSKIFEFKVTISGSSSVVPNGTYDNSAIVLANFTPVGLGAGAYEINTVSSPFLNYDDVENVTINHTFLTLDPSITLPTFLPSLVPTISSTPSLAPTSTTPASSFGHPSSDPLTCLQLNGSTPISFSDVPGSLLQAPYVNFLTSTVFASDPTVRLSRGYSNGTFGTNNTLTRFELTKMALGANCSNYISSPSPNSFFSDVPRDNSEMSLVIGKAYAQGIVSGVGDRFYPDRPVSYGEMVKILVGAGVYFDHGTALSPLSSTLTGIGDESFRQFAEHAARMNLVNLGSGSSFPQNDQVQRRFMAQAVARYIAWLKNISLV
jgi:uncharacterized repeat protein (TIGR01451 family)